MRKILLVLVAVVALCGTSFAWGSRGHATTVQIAENHLTPKAKKLLAKYLHGKSIVDYASWADEYKKELKFELDFEPSNAPRILRYPHTFAVNADCSVFEGDRKGNAWVKNCVYMADGYIKELMENHSKMNDELRLHKIAMLIHWLADMHCPVHIRYHDEWESRGYAVMVNDREVGYHRLWDGLLFNWAHPSSLGDPVETIDTCTSAEIAKITEGNIYDWGKESATVSRVTRKYGEGAQLDRRELVEEFSELLDSQIRNGGYRLAKLFNDIFK